MLTYRMNDSFHFSKLCLLLLHSKVQICNSTCEMIHFLLSLSFFSSLLFTLSKNL